MGFHQDQDFKPDDWLERMYKYLRLWISTLETIMVMFNVKTLIFKLLALALSNLVHDLANLVTKWPTLALANLVTNLTKPSLDLDKTWARTRHYI